MAYVVYGTPYRPPAPSPPAWSRLPMTWTAKGVEWSLSNPESGLFLLPGVRGLGSVRTDRHVTSSPGAAGSRFEGVSVLDREVFWPVHIYHDTGSVDWMLRDREFWRGMDPADTGVWRVTHPDGAHRSLALRFTSDGDHTSNGDPVLRGWETYGITLVAEKPYWEGAPEVKSFAGTAPPLPFFPDPASTSAEIVNIAPGYSVSNAAMDNPGDVESYPRWFIDGPATSASVGVGGVVVNVPFAVASGKCLVIESDPDSIGATLYDITAAGLTMKPSDRVIGTDLTNPVDQTPQLGEADFAPIPAGSQVPLSLTLVGEGAVEALLPTLYRRPW